MYGQGTKEQGCTAMAMYTMYVPSTPHRSTALPQRHVLAGLAYSPNETAGAPAVIGVVCRAAGEYHKVLGWA